MRGLKIKEETMKKTGTVCVLAMICCLLWGSAFPSIKVGYELFQIGSGDTASQILFAGCRFALAGVLVIAIGSLLQGEFLRPSKAALPKIAKVCLMQTVIQYFFFYVGLAHTTGVKGSIVEASNVFLAILISSLIFRQEKLEGKKMLGCLVGFAGVVLINLSGGNMELGFNLMGDGFIFISAIAYALSSVFIKKYSQTENPVMLSGYQFLAGGLIMIAGGAAAGGRFGQFSLPCAGILLYMALISAVAYTLWGIMLKYNPVSRVSIFGFMNPVFGVLLSAVILREGSSFGLKGVMALLLVCAGIFIVNAERGASKPERSHR
ncbi:DMT family transporter [Bariatricus massiliensis]|uniref:DMT family transporter n=1 Tax=Bariatricus massiliensis TaxID=1745713 RepID=A0ABS8DHH8_9FIRM|nr:DMT family transporter [Bariatricus massiliensis]MCB7304508.1 DMT family transporter [Bariatricus massiliensis]MCB7375160.1 DMT family transporter [Bariatricus massiliensis]MCB7387619.1 DMT family transporter [Bariatricus massiliensis]MCB7411780.1 DMT family transporter [Bariatricus massiliensis]MCQ5253916.1 DMT family transporter [Bariatricus massiliensis]